MITSASFPNLVRTLSSVLTVVAGLVLFGLAALTVADVVNRNLRGQSILGAVEISALLLVAVAFLGLSAAEINGQHVAVGLIDDRLSRRAQMASALVRTGLIAILGGILVVAMFDVVGSALERGETTNDILRLPTWPAKLVVLVSFALFFILAVWRQILVFDSVRRGENAFVIHPDVLVDQDESTAPEGRRDY